MKTRTLTAAFLTIVTALLTMASSTPSAASAIAAVQAPAGPCGGAGWTEVDSVRLTASSGRLYGIVRLYYGGGYNCATTTKHVAVGTATNASVFVCRQSDGKCNISSGPTTGLIRTGPLYAPNTCVKWGGGVSDIDGSRVYAEVNWSHCG